MDEKDADANVELSFIDRLTWPALLLCYGVWLVVMFMVPDEWVLAFLGMSYLALARYLWLQQAHEEWFARMIHAVGFGAFYFSALALPVFLFGLPPDYASAGGLGADHCYGVRGSHPC